MSRPTSSVASSDVSWRDGLFKPVDNTFLVLFRLVFSSFLVFHVWSYFSADLIRPYYIEPRLHFTWYGFGWIRPWSEDWMYIHFYLLGMAAVCMLCGFYYRLASATFFVGFTYVFLMDQSWYQNHYYLVCLLSFLAIFLPAHHSLSLDVMRRPDLYSRLAPAWTLVLLRVQVGIPYVFGGLAKLNADWLRGQPLRMWLAPHAGGNVFDNWLARPSTGVWMSYGGLMLDLLMVPLLLWRPTRWLAFVGAVLFHGLNAYLFNIGYFPWLMLLVTGLVFFSPDQVARLRCWKGQLGKGQLGKGHAVNKETQLVGTGWAPGRRWTIAALVIYLLWQLLVPLHHWLYPGNPAWTHEDSHFAWRMKLHTAGWSSVFERSIR